MSPNFNVVLDVTADYRITVEVSCPEDGIEDVILASLAEYELGKPKKLDFDIVTIEKER